MGFFESLLGAVISTAMQQSGKASNKMGEAVNKMDQTAEEAARMDTGTLVRRWRNCSDPIKKGVYYREMQTRNDVREYL